LVLSLQGNAITLSRQLWDEGIRDAASLRKQIHHDGGKKTYTFGVGFAHSSQSFLLRQWLEDAGIVPGVEVRIVVVPPAQLFPNLELGYLDGYCVGEPWTTVAVDAGVGICVGSSTFLAPMHPEKVLMVRQDFARQNSSAHEALVAALLEACALCDQPENRKTLAQLLAQPQYVNAPSAYFGSPAELNGNSKNGEIRQWFGSDIFYRFKANDPTEEKAAWICNQLLHSLGGKHDRDYLHKTTALVEKVFQRQPFVAARRKALKHLKTIEAGDSNLQSLRRSGFWPNFRTVAGPHLRRFFKGFPDRQGLSEFTASSSEARTEAGAPYRSSALRLGERKDAFCSPDAAVAGTE
jgi:hypothetical protein